MELHELLKKWEDTYHYGSIHDRLHRSELWMPYYSLVYQSQVVLPLDMPDSNCRMIDNLIDSGVINEESTVIDIGCGGGYYTLQLARSCKSVLALDCNPDAIRLLKARMEASGISNIIARVCSWEEYQAEGSFNVVFSSMCPAICNLDELHRMESLADNYCVIHTVMNGSYNKYRKMMMNELNIKPEGMITEFSLYRDILHALGRDLTEFTEESASSQQLDYESLLHYYPTYFSIFGMSEEASVEFIKAFFDKHQKGGYLTEENLLRMGCLCWRP